MVKVSIIMPSLNVGPYIKECLESALNQTLKEIEIICIDAGSTDGTWEYLQEMETKDTRIRLMHSDVKSYGVQVNMGIKLARGKYIAILETDDYIREDMYELLYDIALREDVDYVKADYTRFFTLKDGTRLFVPIRQFSRGQDLYNKVIEPCSEDSLHITDLNLWRGIYKKAFIDDNKIELSDTPGASYQDIGFNEQVFFYGKTAYYSNEYLYYYRTDREDASTYSIKALKNTWYEFKRFYERFVVGHNLDSYHGFFLHLLRAFRVEYEKTLIKSQFDCEATSCNDYYPWFKEVLEFSISQGVLTKSDIELEGYDRVKLLLDSPWEFAKMLEEETYNNTLYLNKLDYEGEKQIVIFGAGHKGCELVKYFDDMIDVEVVAFADNDKEKQRREDLCIPVYGLKTCLDMFPDAWFIIANERYYEEMAQQYIVERGNREKLLN